MATKNQRRIGGLFGSIAGALIGNYLCNKNEASEKKFKYVAGGALIGGTSGYLIAELFGSPNDTVNYEGLDVDGTIVYHGITYEYRIDKRIQEHRRSGKMFSQVKVSSARPREEALGVEKKLIQLDKPKYNVQHNKEKI